jgi:5-methylcytosine-specific restriction endonuclease McrA
MRIDEKPLEFQRLATKCLECGIEPSVFLNEKMLELEERKRILLTPTANWYHTNKHRYEGFAQKVLRRDLTETERFGKYEKLSEWIERKIFPPALGPALDAMLKNRLLQDCNSRCAHCGKILTVETMQVDHILPRIQGGSDEILNLQPLCKDCNQGKSAFTEDTAEAAGRPWFEPAFRLLQGKAGLTSLKRYCVLARDDRRCRRCGRSSSEAELIVVPRVSKRDGGQLVYDNLLTICRDCIA